MSKPEVSFRLNRGPWPKDDQFRDITDKGRSYSAELRVGKLVLTSAYIGASSEELIDEIERRLADVFKPIITRDKEKDQAEIPGV